MKAKSLYPSPAESRCALAVSRGRAFCNGFPAELPAASKGRTTARPSPRSRLGVPERASKEMSRLLPAARSRILYLTGFSVRDLFSTVD